MQKTFKLIGLLLNYPSQALQEALLEIGQVLRAENMLPKKHIKSLQIFIDTHSKKDLIDWQEEYVHIFDRSRNHSLYLFEHVHGESRDRGMAMVNLKEMYEHKGLNINKNELPDYLPLFLEYLSFCNPKEAKDLLGETIDIIATIGMHLKKFGSDYAVLCNSLEALSAAKIDYEKVTQLVENAPKDPETFDEIDAQWEEADAFANETDCNGCATDSNKTNSQQLLSGVTR